jgi:hypothetical protein
MTASPSRRQDARDLAPDADPPAAAAVSLDGEVQWHLAEVTAALRGAPRPLRPVLLRVVLHGLGELCELLHQRAHEPPVAAPSLLGDTPVVAEALGIWEARVRQAITQQHASRDKEQSSHDRPQPPPAKRFARGRQDRWWDRPGAPNAARICAYLLGGNDSRSRRPCRRRGPACGRVTGRRGRRENRAFLGRAVGFLAQQGVRRFLDVGTGLPAHGDVHEVAQAVAPGARVACVDNDPMVCAHARALLADQATAIAIQGDLRQPEAIVGHPEVRRLLGVGRPVGCFILVWRLRRCGLASTRRRRWCPAAPTRSCGCSTGSSWCRRGWCRRRPGAQAPIWTLTVPPARVSGGSTSAAPIGPGPAAGPAR